MLSEDFRRSLTQAEPPAALSGAAAALWWDLRGDWERAHAIAQELPTEQGAWLHAYLHRREGDAGNAAYWYRRAGRPACRESLDAERQMLLEASLP